MYFAEKNYPLNLTDTDITNNDIDKKIKTKHQNNSTTKGTDNLESTSQRQGFRESYVAEIQIIEPRYISYACSNTAFWAAKLTIDPTVKNFKISHNDERWGDFGDVAIEVEFTDYPGKPSVTVNYVIKFEDTVSTKVRFIETLEDGSVSFDTILSNLAGIEKEPDWVYTKFIVFTTAPPSPALTTYVKPIGVQFCEICFKLADICSCSTDGNYRKDVPVFLSRPFSNREINLFYTSDDLYSIFYIFPSNQQYLLPKLYLFTCQKQPRYLPTAIDDIFSGVANESHQLKVSRDLIKYIENWNEGRCGGIYKLTKEDVLVHIGNLFLSKYIVTPEVNPVNHNSSLDIWLNATNNAEVTVLKTPINLSKICQPYNSVIEKEVGLPINITTDTIRFRRSQEQDDIKGIKNSFLKYSLLEEVSNKVKEADVSIEKLYMIFWKAGMLPMILKVSNPIDQEWVLQVIDLLKSFGLNRKYFLLTSDDNIKTVVKDFKNVSFFVTLDDVADKIGSSVMDQVKIQVTDVFSLSLGMIHKTDKHFQNTVSANEFFDMALGKYAFKPAEIEDGVEKSKLVLSDDQMRTLRYQVESKDELRCILKDERAVSKNHWLRGLNPNIFK